VFTISSAEREEEEEKEEEEEEEEWMLGPWGKERRMWWREKIHIRRARNETAGQGIHRET